MRGIRVLGVGLLVVAVLGALGAIWSPWHWQMGATAVLALFTAAGLLGTAEKHPEGDLRGYSPEEIARETEKHDRRAAALAPRDHCPPHGRTYGRKADQ